MATTSQSFEKHTRWDPLYHFFIVPVTIITALGVGYRFIKTPTWIFAWEVVVMTALIVALFKLRLYALKVQDRVIRLEERLRLSSLVPSDLRSRINDLSESQLIALRFCGDEDLAALFKRALDEKLEPKEIKKSVKNWRADEFRV